jgi:hypothetical protein
VKHGLYVHEIAWLFGYTLGRMKDKLYGRSPIGLTTDRLTTQVDMLLALGVRPDGWPQRLSRRIHANKIVYNGDQSPIVGKELA